MSNLILIPENLMALSGAGIVAQSNASASMADTNLLNESPSEFWRSTTSVPSATGMRFYVSGAAEVSVSALAMVGHNLHRGDQYRLVLGSAGAASSLYYTEALAPSAISASTNATGLVTAIDDSGFSTDANWMTPTTGTDWDVLLDFPTPGAAPVSGVGLQSFWVYVKAGATVTYGTNAPTVLCQLMEAGAEKQNLGTKFIVSATGQWLCFPWNAANLATASGAAVQVKLTFSGVDYALETTGYPAGNLGSVVWVEEASGLFTPVSGGDLGWQTYSPFTGSGVSYEPEVSGGGSAIYIPFGGTKTPSIFHLLIRSDHAPTDFLPKSERLTVPPGYVQIGCLILGEAWSPATDRNFGQLVSTKDYSSKSRTYGGQRFGSRRFVQRILSLPLDWLTPDEAHTLFDRILWRHGILKPILVSILPGDATEGKHTTFLASLRNPENAMQATTTRGKSRAMNLEFEEEL